MSHKIKMKIARISFWVAFGLSITLLVAGFLMPPVGIIDGSVLMAVGELFAFAALAVGASAIAAGKDAKIQKGDLSVLVGDINKPDDETQVL